MLRPFHILSQLFSLCTHILTSAVQFFLLFSNKFDLVSFQSLIDFAMFHFGSILGFIWDFNIPLDFFISFSYDWRFLFKFYFYNYFRCIFFYIDCRLPLNFFIRGWFDFISFWFDCRFPAGHFGTLIGLTFLSAGVACLLQFPLFIWANHTPPLTYTHVSR